MARIEDIPQPTRDAVLAVPCPSFDTQPFVVGTVVSAFAPVDRLRFGHPATRSGRLQDAERYRGLAHVLPAPRCRGNMLAHAGPAAQEVSQLVVAAAIACR